MHDPPLLFTTSPPSTLWHHSSAEMYGWDKTRALAALDVAEIPFDVIDGNIMGYATGRQVSISPINPRPLKTLFHELAHILLGHTSESPQADSEVTPCSLREAEAESVALLCCEALGLPGTEECRGYIQHWYGQPKRISLWEVHPVLVIYICPSTSVPCNPATPSQKWETLGELATKHPK